MARPGENSSSEVKRRSGCCRRCATGVVDVWWWADAELGRGRVGLVELKLARSEVQLPDLDRWIGDEPIWDWTTSSELHAA